MTTPQNEPGDHQLSFKFVLVGDSAVGKTAMCKMFCENKFNPSQPQTIGLEFGTRIVEVQGVRIKLQIWDTAGQERFHSITRAYFRSSAAVFLVYDVTNRESFGRLGQWVEDAMQLAPEDQINIPVKPRNPVLTAKKNKRASQLYRRQSSAETPHVSLNIKN